ncbi:hypothetical protein HK101_004622 [Irineochytrium annulatum]|nr:hypothetical protein HK101_004622 [Irineochytrium annulatum]
MDYCIQGACLKDLGFILDSTAKGEMGISALAFAQLDGTFQRVVEGLGPLRSPEGHLLFTVSHVASLVSSVLACEGNSTDSDFDIAARFFVDLHWSPPADAYEYSSQLADVDFLRHFVDPSILRVIDAEAITTTSMTSAQIQAGTSKFASDFRQVSIAFVSLLFPFNVQAIQRVVVCFLEALKLHGGVYQQYAGDVIITSARLMKFSKFNDMLILDQTTNEAVKLLQATVDIGNVKVKGKEDEIHVYGLPWLAEIASGVQRTMYDYQSERIILKDKFNSWMEKHERAVIFIEGMSGMGKTCLSNYTVELAKHSGVRVCLIQGNEISQWRSFSGIEVLLRFIFKTRKKRHVGSANGLRRAFTQSTMSFDHSGFFTRSESADALLKSEFENYVRAYLLDAGVEVTLSPLLSMIFPDFYFSETSRIDMMDGQSKHSALKAIVLKIVAHFVQRQSAIFIFDDAFVQSSDAHLLLLGLKESEALRMTTKGNPLFLEMTIEVAIARFESDLKVDQNRQLTLQDPTSDPDSILSDLASAILFQFDRLSPVFQRMLRGASVLGQLTNMPISETEALRIIKENDIYDFITIEESDEEIGSFFRHVGISTAIYDSLSFDERLEANASVGNMFELLLDDSNRSAVLPSLEFHFSRTREVDKIVTYKEELGSPDVSPESQQKWDESVDPVQIEHVALGIMTEYLTTDQHYSKLEALYLTLRHVHFVLHHTNDINEWCTALYKDAILLNVYAPQYFRSLKKAGDKVDAGRNHPAYMFYKGLLMLSGPSYRDCIPTMMQGAEFCKLIGLESVENVQYVVAGTVAFAIGDFAFLDVVIEPIYKSSEFLRNDHVLRIQLTDVLYRVALARGCMEIIAEWEAEFGRVGGV